MKTNPSGCLTTPCNVLQIRQDAFRFHHRGVGARSDLQDAVNRQRDPTLSGMSEDELIAGIGFAPGKTESAADVVNRQHLARHIHHPQNGSRQGRKGSDCHHADDTLDRIKPKGVALVIQCEDNQRAFSLLQGWDKRSHAESFTH